ncbi:MAG: PIN domain-containing protein [Terriglobales bacterium]
MICALDTNILIYAEGLNGEAMQARARSVLKSLSDRACIPLQVAWELYTVLIRRAGRSPEAAPAAAHLWEQRYPLLESSAGQALAPLDLACEHRLSVWDAAVMAAAQAGGFAFSSPRTCNTVLPGVELRWSIRLPHRRTRYCGNFPREPYRFSPSSSSSSRPSALSLSSTA